MKNVHRIDAQQNKTRKASKSALAARAAINRINSTHSTGPKSEEGKAKVSANALKHGFFANAATIHPCDNLAYQDNLCDLRNGLHPDGPVDEMLIKELAMFTTRLKRLEAAEYALICSGIETNPNDAREIAAAYLNNGEALERLHKAETHLRRAYNRTWDRLQRMQKERLKMPLDQALKQSQIWATAEAIRNNRPELIPPRHPDLDEKGKLKKYPEGHPLYRPKEDHDDDVPDNKRSPSRDQ